MTIILAAKDNNKVHMIADAAITDGNGLRSVYPDSKLAVIHRKFIIGFAGPIGGKHSVLGFCNTQLTNPTGLDLNTLSLMIYLHLASVKEDGTALLITDGKEISFTHSKGWSIYDNYYAIGTGYQFTLGAFTVIDKSLPIKQRLEMAVNATATFYGDVLGPFQYLNI